MPIYRYQWTGVSVSGLQGMLDPAVTVQAVGPAPVGMIDINLSASDPTSKADLDAAMAAQGFVFVEANPDAPMDNEIDVVGTTTDASPILSVIIPVPSPGNVCTVNWTFTGVVTVASSAPGGAAVNDVCMIQGVSCAKNPGGGQVVVPVTFVTEADSRFVDPSQTGDFTTNSFSVGQFTIDINQGGPLNAGATITWRLKANLTYGP
jgi:hypothetical protein